MVNMPLVTTTEMFKKAYDGGYAIGAFNVNNMEIVQGITEAAQEENCLLYTSHHSRASGRAPEAAGVRAGDRSRNAAHIHHRTPLCENQ